MHDYYIDTKHLIINITKNTQVFQYMLKSKDYDQ